MSSRNRPVKVYWEDAASRILNLLITLSDEPKFRSTAWIGAKVDGYSGAPDTVRKQLERDRALLADLGVRLEEKSTPDDDGQTEKLYRLDTASSYLPTVQFTPGQWDAVAAAGRWAMEDNLAEAVQAAVVKLTPASPLDAGHGVAPVVGAVPDSTDLTDTDVRRLRHALDHRLRLRFHYWPRLTADAQERTLEPWGVAAVDGRLFLTGLDVDRGAQRTFRLSRIAELEIVEEFCAWPVPDRPVRALVTEGLEAASTLVTARVLFRTEGALELRAHAHGEASSHDEGEVLTVGPVDRTWLARTAAAYAPDAVVLDPPDLVADIVARLERAHDLLGGSR
ncbi:helix-turn-helix transcriptional regulator [Corynebacterium variabile]|uniref:helix-turn-helix transcriptional regulator n=1 Tax=Corynebacterium variabile TaxID=1727 RepID=UPI003FD2D7EE